MSQQKPRDIKEYKNWLEQTHKLKITKSTETYYDSVTSKIKRDFENSSLWIQLVQNLKNFDGEYRLKTGYPLLAFDIEPEIYIKPFDSFLLKTYRKNVIENKNWPEEPNEGWVLPNNPDTWHPKINDIIRTLIVVKYLDGIEFMVNKIKDICERQNISCRSFFEAREEGYYAVHSYVTQEFEVPKVTWDTKTINLSVEIQITTQLQEVIRKLLHKYYEQRRRISGNKDTKWQWNYKSDEFVVNYLGHILHYVEGMIMEIRERQKEKQNE